MTDLPPLPSLDGPLARRLPPGGARREWQRAEVVAVRDETPRARTFRLRLDSAHPHTPGQHYVVRVTDPAGTSVQRSYSIASAPARTPPPGGWPGPAEFELTVERLDDGLLSGFLHEEVGVGSVVDVRGPFGGWFVWTLDTPALLVGGGSGVVPLRSMLFAWRDRGEPVPLRLVVSARSPQDLLYSGEYGAETSVLFTREAPAGFRRGPHRLDANDLAPLLADLPEATVAYVCGSTGFAEHASRLLVDLGLPAAQVRVERFGAT